MDIRKKQKWTLQDIYLRESELLKFELFSANTANKKWWQEIKSILSDEVYQKEVIKLRKNKFGITSLVGIVSSRILLTFSNQVNEEIIDSLLTNILFGYQDDEKKTPLMYTGEALDCSFLKFIITREDLKIKEKFNPKITEGIIGMILREEYDDELIGIFLIRPDINLKYKKKVIDAIPYDELENLTIKWNTSLEETLCSFIIMGDCMSEMDDELLKEGETKNLNFNQVIQLIDQKLYG